jgi:ubiquitin conjugation factor E4 B
MIADRIPQIDRIDLHYYAHTSRINIKEETRINAISEEAVEWENCHRLGPGQWFSRPSLFGLYLFRPGAQLSNFISEIFYLTLASGHYGLQKTIHTFDELSKEQDEVQRQIDNVTADSTWMGVRISHRICHLSLMSETSDSYAGTGRSCHQTDEG